jgi:hypothetical protein
VSGRRRAGRRARTRAALRLLVPSAACATAVAASVLLIQACATLPPRNPDDLCAIFAENRHWHEAARRSYESWGVPEPVLLAVLHQESRFRARAVPPFRKLFGVIPAGRLTSAYGYGQVKAGTWRDYVQDTGNRRAARDDFADVVDFIGWYGALIQRVTGVASDDAYNLYLAYHEGPWGYGRGSHEEKPWLLGVARKVERRAALYASQYEACRDAPSRRRAWLF